MSTFRSHLRHHLQQNASSQDPQSTKQASRIPTKHSNTHVHQQGQAAASAARLAKRASLSVNMDSQIPKASSAAAQPVTVARSPSGSSKRLSAAHSPATSSRHSMLPPPTVIRTPSLVSGSSVSTSESPKSLLRRKPSGAIDRFAAQRRADKMGLDPEHVVAASHRDMYGEDLDDSVFGLLPPNSLYKEPGAPLSVTSGLDYDAHHASLGVAFNVTPPVPMYAPSSTPSTRYSDSPFSHAPTPSSMSSYSSGIPATSESSSQQQTSSPSNERSNVKTESTRLTPVRESSTSSSNKTIKAKDSKSPPKQETLGKHTAGSSSTKASELRTRPSRNKLRKEQIIPASTKKPVQRPPELAHLDTEDATKTAQRPLPPRRPSRDGTTNIADMNGPSPIVQSDLPRLYTTYHKRTPSQDTPVSASSPGLRTRFGRSSKSSSRTTSPRIDSAISPPPAARTFTRGSTPDHSSPEISRGERIDSPAVGSSASPAKSQRFGFFSRKSKPDGFGAAEKPKRSTTKGPVAGTGHEGYGKFGYRGRSGSVSSSAGFRSPSTDSSTSNAPRLQPSRNSSLASKDGSDLDDFLRERLNPVVLRGSGTGSTISSSTLNSDMQASSLKHIPSNLSVASPATPQLLPSAMQKTNGMALKTRPPLKRGESSDLSDDGLMPPLQHSSARVSRISRNDYSSPGTAPKPQDAGLSKRLPVASEKAEHANTLLLKNAAAHGNEGSWLRSAAVEPIRKPSRKFPFYQRAQESPRSKVDAKTGDSPGTSGSSARIIQKPVPQYGILEPVQPVGLDEIARLVLEAETSHEDSMSETSVAPRLASLEGRRPSLLSSRKGSIDANQDPFDKFASSKTAMGQTKSEASPEVLKSHAASFEHRTGSITVPVLSHDQELSNNKPAAPDPPEAARNAMTPEPKVLLETPQQQSSNSSPRPPRLSPVGRIPRVVSTRDRDRKLPDTSFSRPFARTQPKPTVKPPGSVYTQIRDMATSPVDMSSTSTRSDANSADRRSGTFTAVQSTSTGRTSMDIHAHAEPEFLAFPPRKNSDQSYSSSSASQGWPATAHARPYLQDDMWNEYDDLMDNVMVPRAMTTDAPALTPVLVQGDVRQRYILPPLRSGPPTTALPLPPGSSAPSAIVPIVLSVPEQIARFLQPSLSPLTPDRASALIGSQSTSTLHPHNRASFQSTQGSSIPQPRRASVASTARTSFASSYDSRNSVHSRSFSYPDKNARNSQSSFADFQSKRNSKMLFAPEDQATVARLRYGALVTSKWLSFGRILFSPGHNAIAVADNPRILVVDGLSSDWSLYVAQSYPTAAVYNLSLPKADAEVEMWPSDQEVPRNHKQIRWDGMTVQMPFPRGFFNVVVFRFPIAASEEEYRLCISECKRVLRPGGFLELAVLDLDLMNMGSRARRAIRDMKTGIQMRNQDVSLGNLSDVLLRLIGRRGFEDIQRCIVGVPAAGRIPSSADGSSIASEGSGRISWKPEDLGDIGGEISFADLLKNSGEKHRHGRSDDEDITKMVAKIGRWWYTSCYERPYYPAHRSIWRDRALLRECETQGTSFRLLICHAQKPTQPRRRTVSV